MGFRSTLITECFHSSLPEWFVQKYPHLSYWHKDGSARLSFAILEERKFYDRFAAAPLFLDIQKVLIEMDISVPFPIVLLHECGGLTRIQITKTDIRGSEPTGWREVENVTHDYCYGCSDLK